MLLNQMQNTNQTRLRYESLREKMSRHVNHYSIESANRNRGNDSGLISSKARLENIAHQKAQIEQEHKRKELICSLTLLSQIDQMLPIVGETLSPLAVMALGNIAKQASSTLKLLQD